MSLIGNVKALVFNYLFFVLVLTARININHERGPGPVNEVTAKSLENAKTGSTGRLQKNRKKPSLRK